LKKLALIIIFILAGTSSLASEDASGDIKFGLGFQFDGFTPGTTVYVPIIISEKMNIEPFFRQRSYQSDDGTGSSKYTSTYSYTKYGVGLSFKTYKNRIIFHKGFRIGIINYSSSRKYDQQSIYYSDEEVSYTGNFISFVLSAEYFFADSFSISGEITPIYTLSQSGDLELTWDGGSSSGDYKYTSLENQTALIVRWYY